MTALSPLNRALALRQAADNYLSGERSGEDTEKKRTTKDALWRLLSATMAILNHTQAELDRAHKNIDDLSRRVSNLESLAMTDELTGLKNRRGFEASFAQELDRASRSQSNGGVLVLIDLDNFKTINDTYSHLAGDACLKLVGRTLANEIRMMDTAARLGGDEFVLMLTNASKQDALSRIQMLAWQLNNLSLIWEGHEIEIRASIGVKDYKPGDLAHDIYKEADSALYADKSRVKENA